MANTNKYYTKVVKDKRVKMDGGRKVCVYLDAESVAKASYLGDGNISDGIRIALMPTTIQGE